MDINKIKAVAFDCDGVMFDTSQVNRMYYNQVLEHFGKPVLTQKQFEKVHMSTVIEALSYLFPEKTNLDDLYDYLKGVGYHRFISYMQREPGLRRLLDRLRQKGYKLGVATNRTNTMEAVLNEFSLKDSFDMVVTAADVEKPKPAPDQLFKLLSAFDLAPDQMLFIGDTEYDEMAASGAGTPFIAFKNSLLTADFHVETMEDIKDILELDRAESISAPLINTK